MKTQENYCPNSGSTSPHKHMSYILCREAFHSICILSVLPPTNILWQLAGKI